MASLSGFFFCTSLMVFVAATAVIVEAASREFKVGDELGWQVPAGNTSVYSQWASRNRFKVGDSLAFEYKNDSVLVVEKWDFFHCNASEPIATFNNGKTLIELDRPGPFYFISGSPGHCKNGQRLLVEVLSPHRPSVSPPSISLPPQSDLAMAPSPYSTSTSGAELVPPISTSVSVVLMAAIVAVAVSAA